MKEGEIRGRGWWWEDSGVASGGKTQDPRFLGVGDVQVGMGERAQEEGAVSKWR